MANIEDSKFDLNYNKIVEGMSPIQMANFFQILQTEDLSSVNRKSTQTSIDEFIQTIYKLNYHILNIKSELTKMFETLDIYKVDEKDLLISIQTLVKTYNLTLKGCINTIENADNILTSNSAQIRKNISDKKTNKK